MPRPIITFTSTYSSNYNAILSQLKSTTEQRKEVEKPIKLNSMCGNAVHMNMSGKANMRTKSSFPYYIIYSHHDDGLVCCAFQVSAMNFITITFSKWQVCIAQLVKINPLLTCLDCSFVLSPGPTGGSRVGSSCK